MKPRHEIPASHLAGDIVSPSDPRQKCAFIAGGIGITPFRSMIQYLLDIRQWRPIVLFYVAKTEKDFVCRNVFEQARQMLGIKTIYTVTGDRRLTPGWNGRIGRIAPQMLQAEVPDYQACQFYISGALRMVESFSELLRHMPVPGDQIKTDYFSGLA
jgi:glycine betaine catabolism B